MVVLFLFIPLSLVACDDDKIRKELLLRERYPFTEAQRLQFLRGLSGNATFLAILDEDKPLKTVSTETDPLLQKQKNKS